MHSEPSRPGLNQSTQELWRSLVSMVKSAYNLAPAAVVVLALIITAVVWIALNSTKLMVGVILLLVLAVAVLVYVTTEKYGEAALALVGGLLTAYSVEWSAARFVAFMGVWSAFSFMALIIASMKLAMKSESIFRQAALAYASDVTQAAVIEAQLRSVADNRSIQGLGPIERAETIRLFVFRKLPLEVMPAGLKAVAMLSVIMQLPHLTVAQFVADVYRLFDATNSITGEIIIDLVYRTIRESAAPPVDFITAFQNSRRLVLSKSLDADTFFAELQNALESGVPAESMADYLTSRATIPEL